MVMQRQKNEAPVSPLAHFAGEILGLLKSILATLASLLPKDKADSPVGVGRQTVAIVGRPVQLVTTPWYARYVIIQAETDNTGFIIVGGGSVTGLLARRKGITLSPGEKTPVMPAGDYWLDTTVADDGVTFIFW